MNTRAALAVLLLAALPLSADVTIDGNAIVATVTPYAETAWLSVDHPQWTPWYVTDTDGDGEVRLVYPGEIPSHGLWLGIDLTSGEVMTFRTYFGSPIFTLEETFPEQIFLRDGNGDYSQLSVPGNARAFLLVRPGTGVWYFQGQDGTDSDRDGGMNQLLTVDLADFTPLGPAAPVPSGVEPGDVFLAIDHAMHWFGATVDSARLAATNGPGVLSLAQQELIGLYENQGPLQVNVLRTEGTDGMLSVHYTTVDQTAHVGVDYEYRAGTLTFAQGERLKTIEVPIVDNLVSTGPRRFRIELSNGDMLEVQIVDDIDDDTQIPLITVAGAIAAEDSGFAHFAVHLSHASVHPVEFTATTVAGTAEAGLDYEEDTQTIVIPAGSTSAAIVVPVMDDALDEGDETFSLAFSNSANAALLTTSAEAIILDDDDPLPQLAVADIRVSESTGMATFTVRLSSESATPIHVAFQTIADTATAPNDFAHSINSITFAPGEVSKTIAIPLVNDRAAERDETFRLRVLVEEAPDQQITAICTIVNDDGGRGRAVRH